MLGHRDRRLLQKALRRGVFKLVLVVVVLVLIVARWPHGSAVVTEAVARGVQVFIADLHRGGHR